MARDSRVTLNSLTPQRRLRTGNALASQWRRPHEAIRFHREAQVQPARGSMENIGASAQGKKYAWK